MSSDEEIKKLYNFTLVRFVHRGKKRKVEAIDIVPSKWLRFNNERGRCTTQYLPANSDPEDYEVLHKMVKLLADAPESYTSYSVELVGRAESYKEAKAKLQKLKHDDHVFSLESDESASEMQKKMEKAVKRHNLQQEAIKMKQEMVKNNKTNEFKKDKQKVNKATKQVKKSTVLKDVTHNNILENNTAMLAASTSTQSDNSDTSVDNSLANKSASVENQDPLKIGILDCTLNERKKHLEPDIIASLELPVIQPDNLAYATTFEATVIAYLKDLSTTVDNIAKEQKNINSYLLDKRVVNILNNKVDFESKYGLQLPFSKKEDFDYFNEELKNNLFLKNDICYELTMYVDKDFVLTKSYVRMLKRFLTKDLALQFTAVRASTDKSKVQFRGNEFANCMDVVICGTRAEKGLQTDDKDLISALSNVLCNVRKWSN